MATQINMRYNPYLPQLALLIDGKQPSEYSRLAQFADEDIWEWYSEILDVLYNEIRNDFFYYIYRNRMGYKHYEA